MVIAKLKRRVKRPTCLRKVCQTAHPHTALHRSLCHDAHHRHGASGLGSWRVLEQQHQRGRLESLGTEQQQRNVRLPRCAGTMSSSQALTLRSQRPLTDVMVMGISHHYMLSPNDNYHVPAFKSPANFSRTALALALAEDFQQRLHHFDRYP